MTVIWQEKENAYLRERAKQDKSKQETEGSKLATKPENT